MNERLMEALLSMDRLNSFARNPDGRGPRKAIYWLKSHYAIRDALMAGLVVKMRAVQVTTKCSRCEKGIYRDWDGYSHGACRHCNSTARKTLKFIETTIEARQMSQVIPDINGASSATVRFTDPDTAPVKKLVWHSPIEHSSWLGWPADDLQFVESQDWTVGEHGKPLTTVDLATALNTVETYWPWWRKNSPYELSREEWDSHRYFIFNYALDIGEGAKGCELCGGEHDRWCSFTSTPGITRSASVCKACCENPDVWKQVSALPIPQLHPAIQTWRQRHALNFEDTWRRGWSENVSWQDRRVNGVPVSA